MHFRRKITDNQKAATMVGYALIIALISIAALAAFSIVGRQSEAIFWELEDELARMGGAVVVPW